ncbi:MAG TPA: HRDC domain-containing protein [Accumulibacter sp.]|nr:HRDC domain-containing protein [Accumulibacter sp.]HNM75060.1 HRDC domain-containing protein [Accumulibacter sp.]
MRFHFFTIDALAPAAGASELNAFCAQHRVVSVDKQFIDRGLQACWLFCLSTVDGDGMERPPAGGKRGRIDYREVLSETDFAVFAELRDLRDLRKTLAEQEGVPMYALFTNEQLAEMVTRRATTFAVLGQIEGVGKARLEKYGKYFVKLLGNAFTAASAGAGTALPASHATDGR